MIDSLRVSIQEVRSLQSLGIWLGDVDHRDARLVRGLGERGVGLRTLLWVVNQQIGLPALQQVAERLDILLVGSVPSSMALA